MKAITSLASTITDQVASRGFYHHQDGLSPDEFYEVSEILGDIVRRDDVEPPFNTAKRRVFIGITTEISTLLAGTVSARILLMALCF
jgi:hypothetical protein